ncbi:MAG: comB [Planctomycetaceae bacterium]|nr:comB [Planctomycetaceae bacterium]
MEVHVHLLPKLADPTTMRGRVAVVIDVLRATTSIVHALAAGVESVLPCGEVEQAREMTALRPPGTTLLGGERHGERIPGFDLDNSPLKYTAELLAGKTLVFTTTNGTRALATCLQASRVLISGFVNRQATINALLEDNRPVHLVCAGTDGYVTTEDVLFAGSLADAVYQAQGGSDAADDETQLAIALWRATGSTFAQIRQALRNSRGGRNLIELGFDADIDRSAECDRFDFAAEYFANAGQIQIAKRS